MKPVSSFCLKTVRWSSWSLLALIAGFLFTGYLMSGRFGLGTLMDEKQALTLHKLLHLPLVVFLLVHTVPAVYLALQRWGWIRQ